MIDRPRFDQGSIAPAIGETNDPAYGDTKFDAVIPSLDPSTLRRETMRDFEALNASRGGGAPLQAADPSVGWTRGVYRLFTRFDRVPAIDGADLWPYVEWLGTAFHVGGGLMLTAAHNFVRHIKGHGAQYSNFHSVYFDHSWEPVLNWSVQKPYLTVARPHSDIARFHVARMPYTRFEPEFDLPPTGACIVAGFVCDEPRVCNAPSMHFCKMAVASKSAVEVAYAANTVFGMSGGPLFAYGGMTAYAVHTRLIPSSIGPDVAWGLRLSRAFVEEGWQEQSL